jgi:cell division septation protein DedD
MPDLNLQEEGSLDNLETTGDLGEAVEPTEDTPAKRGGGIGMILVVVLVLAILGGGAFVLNKLGVVHLWGKKPAPAVVQLPDQQPADQAAVQAPASEQAQAPMIETPPVDDKTKAPASGRKSDEKTAVKSTPRQPVKEMPAASAANVGDMKGEFTVQVSAWRDRGTADEMVKRLAEAGYPAFVEGREYKGGAWYTVRIGRYASRKEAESAVQNFAEELKTNYWIDKVKSR